MNKCSWKTQLEMFMVFLKLGAITVGGGLAMIPVIQREVAEKHNWISENDMIDVITVAQSSPGALAINIATAVGYKVGGNIGAVVASFGILLPPFFIIAAASAILSQFKDNIYVAKAFIGIKAAVTGLVGITVYSLGKSALKGLFEAAVILAAFFAVTIFNVHAGYVVISGIAVGFLHYIITRKSI